MSRWSGERPLDRDESAGRTARDTAVTSGSTADRAAVEPIAALVAVVAVGAALGLYVTAIDGATPEHERPVAEATLDRVEPALTVGGVVDPNRLDGLKPFRYATTVEIRADGETWRVGTGATAPELDDPFASDRVAVARQSVTVRVAPGQNVRGTLRAAVRR
ncbi:DUF7285 family protein [Halorubrum laminariae]|uniref:Uncharacterized protein n=1 Tax=Halorubrum laminariae TaxID=1433523 RepID=A0ABD6C0U3_9EURY|nr:hypothetical protein [Halorubrum laminariae]